MSQTKRNLGQRSGATAGVDENAGSAESSSSASPVVGSMICSALRKRDRDFGLSATAVMSTNIRSPAATTER